MIREEINELFVQMHLIESKPNNTDEFIQIVTDAFVLLEKLKNKYYLIPKENIDSNVRFSINDNNYSDSITYTANFSITHVETLFKETIVSTPKDRIKEMLLFYLTNALENTKYIREKKVVID